MASFVEHQLKKKRHTNSLEIFAEIQVTKANNNQKTSQRHLIYEPDMYFVHLNFMTRFCIYTSNQCELVLPNGKVLGW